MEQEQRKKAVNRYLKGESPKTIYTDLKRSKYWFFKWLKRYQTGEPEWYKGKSRTPLNRPTQLGEIEKQSFPEKLGTITTDLELNAVLTIRSSFGIRISIV